jgi:hypothetical protein
MQGNDPNTPAYGPRLTDNLSPSATSPANATLFGGGPMPEETRERVLRAANWFFWIAALSLINSIATHLESRWRFMLGLGVTELADTLVQGFGDWAVAVAIAFDVLAAAVFAGFGLLARRMTLWPFVTGMALYALDGGLLLLAGDYFSAAFHVYVIYCLYLGVRALREYRAIAA